MTIMNKKVLIMTLVLALSFGTMAVFADAVVSPAGSYAELTGMTVADAYDLKGDQTFGDLAKEAGFYEDFKAAVVPAKVDMVQDKADEGLITQTDADAIIELLENCDGSHESVLKDSGLFMKFGQGQGENQGNGDALMAQDGSGLTRANQGGNGLGRK